MNIENLSNQAATAALKAKPAHKISFTIQCELRERAEDALYSVPRVIDKVADYIDLLKYIATSTEFDNTDPRFIAAFDLGARMVRSVAETQGETLLELLPLIEFPENSVPVAA